MAEKIFNNQQQAPAQREEKEKVRVTFNTIPFPATHEAQLILASDLTRQFASVMKKIFPDFEGAYFELDSATGRCYFKVYFMDKTGTDLVPLIPVLKPGQRNVMSDREKIHMFNSAVKKRTYDLTQDTKDKLEPFIDAWGPSRKIEWDKIVREEQDSKPTFNGQQNPILVSVSNISLDAFISNIYGFQEADGSRIEYSIRLVNIKPGNPYNNGTGADYLIQIEKLSTKALDEIFSKFGMYNSGNGMIPMIKG